MYLDFIADYGESTGHEDLAFSEVCRHLAEEFSARGLPMPFAKCLSVRPFNTIETGFVVAQLAVNSKLGANHIVYHNTAPRKDVLQARVKNAGEFLAVAELPNGVRVIGVFSGYTFSFIKDLAPIHRVACAADGSQFRSRDVFPPCVASLAGHAGKPLSSWELLGDKVADTAAVPDNVILSIDGYGNIKTNLRNTAGTRTATINGATQSVAPGEGIFSVQDGQLVIAPGSSGWLGQACVEISLRGGSAAALFNNPAPGDKITLA